MDLSLIHILFNQKRLMQGWCDSPLTELGKRQARCVKEYLAVSYTHLVIYNIAWYEQKAVIVLLALLSLGVKNIHLGPTLPAFLSPNIVDFLVDNFQISGIQSVQEDLNLFFPQTKKEDKFHRDMLVGSIIGMDPQAAQILSDSGMGLSLIHI